MSFKNSRFVHAFLTFTSLRQTAGRIVLSSLLVVIVCVSVLSVTFYVPTSKETINRLEHEMEMNTKLLAEQVDSQLSDKRTILQILAEDGAEYGEEHELHLNNINRSQQLHPEFTSMIYSLDPTGKSAFDLTGKEIDVSGRSYIKDIQAGQSFVSDPVLSKVDNQIIVVIGAPLMKDGQAFGFYLASYPIGSVVEKLSSFTHGETGRAIMTTSDGTFIYFADESYIMNKKISDLGNPALEEAFADAVQNGATSVSFNQDGTNQLSYIVKTDLNWLVVTNLEESEFLQPIRAMLMLVLLVGTGMIIAALILNVFIALKIVYPIRQLTQGIDKLAQGDLTHRIPVKGNNDISTALHAYNTAIERMRELMQDVSGLSGQLSSSAHQLASGADQGSQAAQNISEAIVIVAESSDQQTASVQDGSHAAENIALQINGIAVHSTDAAKIATAASTLATDGHTAMDQLNGKMSEMEHGISELSGTIQDLSTLSAKIEEVVSGISLIARQTNILSLNAAIEASRSGEAGRGFAVVADEIRKLAGQSMASAEQIAGIIGSIQGEIQRTMQASELTVAQALQGRQAGEAASELFTRIRSSIGQVADSIHSVSAAADEIASGTDSLVDSIRHIAKSANETAAESQNVSAAAQQQMASMEEIASSSAELASMAERLRTQIAQFKL
ncbi:methyl-accepting chemotaxis protein [Paenibacillus sp. FSL K6-1230]|uniref:methyl-accepting chemotaxis protein n=1 Tax=Paenibacillus sp. FSL K6-1230 TaxID=2921603 RepID=UPI0030F9BD72